MLCHIGSTVAEAGVPGGSLGPRPCGQAEVRRGEVSAHLTVLPELRSDARRGFLRSLHLDDGSCATYLLRALMGLGAVGHPFSLPRVPQLSLSALLLPYCHSVPRSYNWGPAVTQAWGRHTNKARLMA